MTQTKALEAATAEYVAKLRAIFGPAAEVEVNIGGLTMQSLGATIDYLKEMGDEESRIDYHTRQFDDMATAYVSADINGDGYKIDTLTERL